MRVSSPVVEHRRMALIAALLLGLALLFPYHVFAQCPGQAVAMQPFDEEKLIIGATAAGLTPAKYQPTGSTATMAFVQVQDAPIAYRLTGTPTPTMAAFVTAFASFPICGIDSIKAFRAIRLSTTDAALFVTYYKSRQP